VPYAARTDAIERLIGARISTARRRSQENACAWLRMKSALVRQRLYGPKNHGTADPAVRRKDRRIRQTRPTGATCVIDQAAQERYCGIYPSPCHFD